MKNKLRNEEAPSDAGTFATLDARIGKLPDFLALLGPFPSEEIDSDHSQAGKHAAKLVSNEGKRPECSIPVESQYAPKKGRLPEFPRKPSRAQTDKRAENEKARGISEPEDQNSNHDFPGCFKPRARVQSKHLPEDFFVA